MTRATYILANEHVRARAKLAIDKAPQGYVAEVREPKRTLPQNDKMHAMLTDVARSKFKDCGYDKDDWKQIFIRALRKEQKQRFLQDLDGDLFPAGYRSSELTVREMAELITLIQAWGDQNGVKFSDEGE